MRLGPQLPQVEVVNQGDIDPNMRTESNQKFPGSASSSEFKFKAGRKMTAIQKFREKNL